MLSQVVHSQVPPFEILVIQFYSQLQVSLANHLYEYEFVSLLIGVPLDIMRACLHSYVCPRVSIWLLVHSIKPTFCLSLNHFLKPLGTCLSLPHPIVAHLSQCQCGHTIINPSIHFNMKKRAICNWPCNLIFELQKTFATHYIYDAIHSNLIATLSKQLIFNYYATPL